MADQAGDSKERSFRDFLKIGTQYLFGQSKIENMHGRCKFF